MKFEIPDDLLADTSIDLGPKVLKVVMEANPGKSKAEIARMLGIKPSRVHAWVRAFDKKPCVENPAIKTARDYWEWVLAITGHPPAIGFNPLVGIIESGLKADFTVYQIKMGLKTLHEQARPVTKQTLWNAISVKQGSQSLVEYATRKGLYE